MDAGLKVAGGCFLALICIVIAMVGNPSEALLALVMLGGLLFGGWRLVTGARE